MTAVETSTKIEEKEKKKSVMVISFGHSDIILEPQPFLLFSEEQRHQLQARLHAKASPSSIISLAGPGVADVVTYVEWDLRKTTARVLVKAKKFSAYSDGYPLEETTSRQHSVKQGM